ncbi:MAG: SpoVG family protein [Clostridiales bacterium]|jgi:stage V sporulation protein G|nr:SpoVG family protein [Clostridiales bacterium]
MNITDIRIRLVKKGDIKLKGVASVIIDDSIAVHDIKIIDGSDGSFVAMPSRKGPSGEYRDIVHPIKSEVRKYLCALILDAYDQAVQEDAELAEREPGGQAEQFEE